MDQRRPVFLVESEQVGVGGLGGLGVFDGDGTLPSGVFGSVIGVSRVRLGCGLLGRACVWIRHHNV